MTIQWRDPFSLPWCPHQNGGGGVAHSHVTVFMGGLWGGLGPQGFLLLGFLLPFPTLASTSVSTTRLACHMVSLQVRECLISLASAKSGLLADPKVSFCSFPTSPFNETLRFSPVRHQEPQKQSTSPDILFPYCFPSLAELWSRTLGPLGSPGSPLTWVPPSDLLPNPKGRISLPSARPWFR